MFKFRELLKINSGFGPIAVVALENSASRSTARKVGRRMFFLFDNDESLQVFKSALYNARSESGWYHAQFEHLTWALGEAHSMLLVFRRDELHIMCSEDPAEFEELLSRPIRLGRILKEFRGVSSRYRYGNLAAVPA